MSEYAIGADELPGLSKLIEETGEVQKAIGRLIQCRFLNKEEHWDGMKVKNELLAELGDLTAAIEFVVESSFPDMVAHLKEQHDYKLNLYREWHKDQKK